MSESPQVATVRRFYDAKGDLEVIRSLVAPDAQWDVVEGFPRGGVYDGLDSIIGDFFGFFADFAEFHATADEFYEDRDHVITLGRYTGVTHNGNALTSRFAHFFTLRDGKIIRLRQTSDTVPIDRALRT